MEKLRVFLLLAWPLGQGFCDEAFSFCQIHKVTLGLELMDPVGLPIGFQNKKNTVLI